MTVAHTAAALGILIAGSILLLVRRDRLHGSHALWWLAVAGSALLVGLFPKVVDRIGGTFGVHYPPMLVVLLILAAVLLKLLQIDIDISRRERRMRRMIQKMAILEMELRELRDQSRAAAAAPTAESAAPAALTGRPAAAAGLPVNLPPADTGSGLRKVVG